MTKEELQILGEKIAAGQSSREEVLLFIEEVNKEVGDMNKELVN